MERPPDGNDTRVYSTERELRGLASLADNRNQMLLLLLRPLKL